MGTVLYVRPDDRDGGLPDGLVDGVTVRTAASATAAATAVSGASVDCVVVDFGATEGGLTAVSAVSDRRPDLPVVCCSDRPDAEFAAAATRRGATEYYPRSTTDPSLADRVASHLSGSPDRDAGADDRARDGPTDSRAPQAGAATDEVGRPASVDDAPTDPPVSGAGDRTETLMGAVRDGLYILDETGRFVTVNDAMADLTGYGVDELVGSSVATITDRDSYEQGNGIVEALRDGGTDLGDGEIAEATFETTIGPKTGEPFPAEDHLTPLTDEDGGFVGVAGVLRDVSERKRRERRLREARERFAELLDASRTLLGAHSREAVAETVAETMAETLEFDSNFVRLYDPDSGTLEPTADGPGDDIPIDGRPTYDVGEGGPGIAFEAGETRRYPRDFEADDELTLPDAVETALYVPIGDQGVISAGATDPDGFDERAVSMAEILASNAAVALDRVAYEDELVQYRTVLENVQDMVYVIDESERFSLVTDPLADWLGYDRAELIDASPSQLLDDEATAAFESAIADLWYDDGTGDTVTVETEMLTAEGERCPVTVDVSLLPVDEEYAGTVGVVRDRSELLETREKLEAQRDRFSYLFDNLPDAVVEGMVDESARPVVTAVNEAFSDVFGFDEGTVVGEPLNEFIVPADDESAATELDARTAAGETVQAEVRRRTADGVRDFLFRGIPYETNGDRTRGFGIYTDITAQKERERRLEVLNRVLRHNLRNDLNVVSGYAEMLANRTSDDDLTELAGELYAKATEVATLGDRVRTLDQQMRRDRPRDESVQVPALVEEVVATCRVEHPDVTVETDVESARVVGDGRLTLALTELLDNCVAHAGDDVRVRVSVERDGDRVRVVVADDGPGIPSREREIVDGSVDITQLNHGTGLGLWIVKWVCEACGGRVSFAESPLGGTAVVLSLTRAQEP